MAKYTNRPRRVSFAARKLGTSGAADLLKERRSLRSAYALLKEHQRLRNERTKVPGISKRLRLLIKQLEQSQKKLRTLRERIEEIRSRLEPITAQKCLGSLENACRSLEDCEQDLLQQEKLSIAELHVKERQRYPPQMQWRWELFFKPFNYELGTFRKKAPDQ